MSDGDISRRGVLAGIGASGLGALAVGSDAGSAADHERHIVGTSTPGARDAARNRADEVHRVLEFGSIGHAVAGKFPAEALEALSRNPNVRYIEPDGEMRAISIDSDDAEVPWGVDRVDAEEAHAAGETGGDNTDGAGGAKIAILDTGIDSDHPDLQANINTGDSTSFVSCGSVNGCRFGVKPNSNDCSYNWDDDNDHGSHVAGSADARDNGDYVVGVSTAADLVAIKVLDGCGSGSYSDIAAGINHAADVGCDVANMSLGGSQSSTVADAVQYAYNQGVLLVGSAGNSGPCSDCVGYPAAEPEVIAVSATSKDDSLADFSSTGPEVEVAAPGDNIPSTVPPESSQDGLASFSGTSMSAPHVAGAGGQLMDNGYSNAEARTRLKDTAEDLGLGTNEQGSGLLDVAAAVDTSGDTASAPTLDSLSATEVETSDADAEFDVSWSVSDADGDLSNVDLTLTQDSDGSTEDSASVSVSGDTASGTTRLVAVDDDGTGNGYTVSATVTDSGGRTDSGSTSVSETEDTENDPVVDSLTASEVETSDGDAEFDADWSVSDADGNLDTVDLTLTQDSDGSTEDTATVNVSGSSASGTSRLVAAADDGSGNAYTVTATVTDGAGGTGSASTSVTETESTNTAPSAAIDSVSDNSNPAWQRYAVDWSASDPDGNLDTVTVELRDSGGGVLDSTSTSVSGGSASGSDEVRSKSSPSTVAVTVTDTAGASDTATQSV